MRNILLVIGLAGLTLAVAGCSAFTTGRDWKEQVFVAPVAPDSVFSVASRALAGVGQVQYADVTSRSVSGECEAKVNAAITISEEPDATLVSIKAKMDVAPNMVGGEGGKRQKCIDAIASRFTTLGIALAPTQH